MSLRNLPKSLVEGLKYLFIPTVEYLQGDPWDQMNFTGKETYSELSDGGVLVKVRGRGQCRSSGSDCDGSYDRCFGVCPGHCIFSLSYLLSPELFQKMKGSSKFTVPEVKSIMDDRQFNPVLGAITGDRRYVDLPRKGQDSLAVIDLHDLSFKPDNDKIHKEERIFSNVLRIRK
jgi:hypothetical protein